MPRLTLTKPEIDRILKSNAAVQVFYDRDSMEDYDKLVPEIMKALNLYIHEQMRLARIDELKLIQQCGKDHDLAGAVKWLVEDRIKELEGLVGK